MSIFVVVCRGRRSEINENNDGQKKGFLQSGFLESLFVHENDVIRKTSRHAFWGAIIFFLIGRRSSHGNQRCLFWFQSKKLYSSRYHTSPLHPFFIHPLKPFHPASVDFKEEYWTDPQPLTCLPPMALPRIRFLFVLVLMISVVCHPVLRKRILVKAFSSITTRSLPRGLIQRSSLVSAANPQWTDRRRFSTLDSGTSEPDVADQYGNDPYGYSPNESDWNDDNNDNLELQSNYWQQVHGLNDAQTKAVTQPLHAVTRVVAGPGSGKTRVLTCRIAYLLNNAPHERILAVTFTRKAAGEMQQRLEALLTANDNKQADGDNVQEGNENQSYHPDLNRVTLGTFHSVCGKILRWNGDFLATLPSVQQTMLYSPDPVHLDGSFGIIDQSEQLRILKECLEQGNIDLKNYKDIRPFNVLSAIGKAKSMYAQGENPFALDGKKQLPTLREIASKVYPRYVQKLLSTNCLDFDDLILMARELLDTQPEVRERLQRRWNHVLIDEFQDTSKTQMDLVKLLTSHSLFVVGDADQSIYSWRGAHVGSLQDLEEDFGNVNTVFLMENYRSTSNIVKAAQKIISSSEGGLRQDMKPKRGSGPAPRVVACADDREEGTLRCAVL